MVARWLENHHLRSTASGSTLAAHSHHLKTSQTNRTTNAWTPSPEILVSLLQHRTGHWGFLSPAHMISHVAKGKNHRTTQNLRAGFKTNSSKPNSVPCGRFPNPFPQAPWKPTGFSAEFNLTSISLVPLMNPSHHTPQAH